MKVRTIWLGATLSKMRDQSNQFEDSVLILKIDINLKKNAILKIA